jgi:osmotically-inducible protein OsmY
MPFDKRLQHAVLAELDWEPSVVVGHIGVTATGWVVTLTGHVARNGHPQHDRQMAWATPGANGVENDIAILCSLATK